ncbi:helix-turn-helix domain-containing protein [Congzhengia minquanensis]|uniref:Helix-turn-helix transcriptional regulator n=1 Tax=Congzhengia minquanensis TaxID=2763657 RepID=A0A926DPF5_9FIRM|nr:helix-turn-helix transcriptional regulator [Congzhengia minquanensis]MBC8540929.1 helix-turn-helix transcriptional regulator [Congzhengia minquanensis]
MSDNIKKMIGERIGLALKNADKKQKELAQYLNISDNTVSYFVNGSRTPNTEQIIKIADFLNVSADYLLCRTNVAKADMILQTIAKETGLSERAIERILELKQDKNDTLNLFLSCGLTHEFFEEFKELIIVQKMLNTRRTVKFFEVSEEEFETNFHENNDYNYSIINMEDKLNLKLFNMQNILLEITNYILDEVVEGINGQHNETE